MKRPSKLVVAMGIRVFASALYVGLVLLNTKVNSAASTAALVYILAICYVSSAFGRVGADQQISAHARYFRKKRTVKAASLFLSHLVLGGICVPLAAATIHTVVNSFGLAGATDISVFYIAAIACAFASSQTVGITWQAMGYPSVAVLAFPMATYVLLLVSLLFMPALSGIKLLVAFAVPLVVGLLVIGKGLRPTLAHLSLNWWKRSLDYYVMGINFHVSAWAPFTYLHLLLSSGDIVLINVATRIAALQSMPSNAVSGYLMPIFSINSQRGDHAKTERTMGDVMIISIAFQILYISMLVATYIFAPTVMGLNRSGLLPILLILSVGHFVNALTGPTGPALLMSGEQRKMAITSSILNTTFILTGIVCAKYGGVLAFAGAISAGIIFQNVIYAIFLYQKTGISASRLFVSALGRGATRLIGIVAKS